MTRLRNSLDFDFVLKQLLLKKNKKKKNSHLPKIYHHGGLGWTSREGPQQCFSVCTFLIEHFFLLSSSYLSREQRLEKLSTICAHLRFNCF